MKGRLFSLFALTVLCWLTTVALSAQECFVKLNLLPSPVYAGAWSPALQGLGLAMGANLPLGPGVGQLDLEAAVDGDRSQLIVPLSWRVALLDDQTWRIRVGLGLIGGLAFYRPQPLVVAGAEITSEFAWFWDAKSGLALSLGGRWLHRWGGNLLDSPESWEIPLGLSLNWRW